MTEADWLAAATDSALAGELALVPDRKLHLLTAAFLRRVCDRLACEHTRLAVEATERFADGRITADELGRARTQAAVETAETLWLGGDYRQGHLLLGMDYHTGPGWVGAYEQRLAELGNVLPGVRAGVREPALIAAKAAFYAREFVAWAADPEERPAVVRREIAAQFAIVRDVLGESGGPDRLDPAWHTDTVRLLARGIHRDRAFDRLPILANALMDAGCADDRVLSHCRELREHVRGCWVVDLAMGAVALPRRR